MILRNIRSLIIAGLLGISMGFAVQCADAQLRSTKDLNDVTPGEWAYQALNELIDRYSCFDLYPPGGFEADKALTRAEAAALLNSCLSMVDDLISEDHEDRDDDRIEELDGAIRSAILGAPPDFAEVPDVNEWFYEVMCTGIAGSKLTWTCLDLGYEKQPSEDASLYERETVWELLEPVCRGNEMNSEDCERMLDDIIAQHGVDAAAYIALLGWDRRAEAAQLKIEIGDATAAGAESLFEDGTYGVYGAQAEARSNGQNSTSSTATDAAGSRTD